MFREAGAQVSDNCRSKAAGTCGFWVWLPADGHFPTTKPAKLRLFYSGDDIPQICTDLRPNRP